MWKKHFQPSPSSAKPWLPISQKSYTYRIKPIYLPQRTYILTTQKSYTFFDKFSLRPLFILILPPILFRHFQKFSKLLYPLLLHLPRIHHLSVSLQPVQHIMLLNPVFRRIPVIGLNKPHNLLISCQPTCFLIHYTINLYCLQRKSHSKTNWQVCIEILFPCLLLMTRIRYLRWRLLLKSLMNGS